MELKTRHKKHVKHSNFFLFVHPISRTQYLHKRSISVQLNLINRHT